MRYLLASLGLALLLCAGTSLPAAADDGDSYRERWTERSSERVRAKRAYRHRQVVRYYYDEDEDEVRPRRRVYRHDRTYRSRYVKRQPARVARQIRRHKRVVRKPSVTRKAAETRRKPPKVTTPAPAITTPKATAPKTATPKPKAPKTATPEKVRPKGSLHGVASFYWQPQMLASGGRFNPNALTAAHKTLPFGTRVRVTHLGNGKSVEVKINDRGPYVAGRIIDLSKAAAGVIGMTAQGVARVMVEILGK
ncbi:MAG TPA: septal ring lytic transglycosylase RlpA family protein [Hyphomicrobiaceae bacterium]|nr:septal ring lytic transglycosylase RlpA family protein [Hyphomicrobiaceae bacterium]